MRNGKKLIVVADDDREIRDVLSLLLGGEGYEVLTAADGHEALSLATPDADLYILDVNMPALSGIMTAAEIRKQADTPIIFLTAYSGESDKVMGVVLSAAAAAAFFGIMVGVTGAFLGQLAVALLAVALIVASVVLGILGAKRPKLFLVARIVAAASIVIGMLGAFFIAIYQRMCYNRQSDFTVERGSDVSHKYHNQYFSVLGDSISTLSGYSKPEEAVFYHGMNKLEADVYAPADTWWGQVIELLGAQLLVNDSFSGSMVTKRPDCIYPSYGCSDERTSALHNRHATPDVIMVYLGTNDWGCGAQPLPEAEEQANDLTVFSVAYTEMLKKLRANYPDAEIWCFTLAVSTYSAHPDFAFPYRYRKRHIAEYCEVIRDCARSQGCRLIDLYEGAEPYDTVDGFHPNRQGMQTLSAAVISELAKGDAI